MDRVPSTPEEFAVIFNDVEGYPTIKSVADALDVSVQAIKNRASRMRRSHDRGSDVPHLINRVTTLTEDQAKFHPEWGPEECIDELVRLCELEPDRYFTRNAFRNESGISESTWTRFFGTFQEFKRQAGITPTRQVRMVEKHVAKHASADHYRRMSEHRFQYGGKYELDKGRKGRFKTILVGTDLHDVECDRFWLRTFIDTARRVQPDIICLNGDVFDLPEFGKYNVDPRTWDAVGRIKFVHNNILGPLREASPNSQMDLIEGNHEFRLIRHLADESPAMMAVLSDLHGLTVAGLFGLDKFEVNYIAKAELAAFRVSDIKKEIAKNYKIYYDTAIAHHFPEGRHMGMPGWNGHHHKHLVWPSYSPIFGSFEWQQLGCGHIRDATYCAGEKWSNGFALVNIDTHTKQTNFDYVPITDFAVVGGQFYQREESERFM